MTKEEKQLLFKDLCARIPYGVKLYVKGVGGCSHTGRLLKIDNIVEDNIIFVYIDTTGFGYILGHDEIKPYLSPMSSMTKEEKSDLEWIVHDETDGYCTNDKPYYTGDKIVYLDNIPDYIDFMCEHHLDYRGLIEKGLAIEAPEEMYKEQNEKVEH